MQKTMNMEGTSIIWQKAWKRRGAGTGSYKPLAGSWEVRILGFDA